MQGLMRLGAILVWLPMAALAQSYPAALSDHVSDYADLLDDPTEARISATLQAARAETGVHIVVATINQQADYGGTGRFADFATGWFNTWGIGDATRDDGILLLIGQADREMRIVLGDGFDVIWDGRAQRVIDTALLPAFRNQDYAAGIEAGAHLAVEQLARPYAAKEAVTETSGLPPDSPPDWWIFGLALAGFAAFSVWSGRIGPFLKTQRYRLMRCPACGKRGLRQTRDVVQEAGETTDGEGVTHLRCPACGDDRASGFVIPSQSKRRAAKSSSSGFGGGRSSGGGASGRW